MLVHQRVYRLLLYRWLEGMYYYLSRKVAWWYQVKTIFQYLSVKWLNNQVWMIRCWHSRKRCRYLHPYYIYIYSHVQMLIKQLVKNLQYLVKDLDFFSGSYPDVCLYPGKYSYSCSWDLVKIYFTKIEIQYSYLDKGGIAVPLPFSALSRSPKIEHQDGL